MARGLGEVARPELTRETSGLHAKSDDFVDHHVRLQHAVLHPQKLSHAPSVIVA